MWNVPHRLTCINTWSPEVGTVWGDYRIFARGIALLGVRYVCVGACYSGYVDARAQHCRVVVLFSSLVAFWGTNSGSQGCRASNLNSGPSYSLFLWILFSREAQREASPEVSLAMQHWTHQWGIIFNYLQSHWYFIPQGCLCVYRWVFVHTYASPYLFV